MVVGMNRSYAPGAPTSSRMARGLASRPSKFEVISSKATPCLQGSSLKGSITPQYGGSIATGYRELSKNRTLAGRQAARLFTGNESDNGQNRMKMVSRLRKKEKAILWRFYIDDFFRLAIANMVRFNPLHLIFPEYNIASSAVRFRGR